MIDLKEILLYHLPKDDIRAVRASDAPEQNSPAAQKGKPFAN
jgi:hypothetical protein